MASRLLILAGCLPLVACHAEGPSDIVKAGLGRLHSPQYVCELIGLGGTTLRPGPYGFTVPGAPGVALGGWIDDRPYLGHEQWWDGSGRRVTPFDLIGGYGDSCRPGEIEAFSHHLSIGSGLLRIDLGLRVDGQSFRSTREEFVTPHGVLVVRVRDAAGAPERFRLRLSARDGHRLRSAGGGSELAVSVLLTGGTRAVLAVAAEGAAVGGEGAELIAQRPAREVVLYIAPASSRDAPNPAGTALAAAREARRRGFARLRAETTAWWAGFHGVSHVELPDPDLQAWFDRSRYYHGVLFGNTRIPPGMWGTFPAAYGAAPVPEYDLVFSQLGLLYCGHLAEARGVAEWLLDVLPQCRRNARETVLYEARVAHARGAKYGWIMEPGGGVYRAVQPPEAANLYANFPGANAARMVLGAAETAGDPALLARAERLLAEVGSVVRDDLVWSETEGGYLDRRIPNSLQQSAARYVLGECARRGVGEPEWGVVAERTVLPTVVAEGQRVIGAGPGSPPGPGGVDAPWLSSLWWYDGLDPTDPLAEATYDLLGVEGTGWYVFNRGWASIYASRLGRAEDALRWLRLLIEPGAAAHDDTCLGEMVHDGEDFQRTPEIAAHGALLCAVAKMLLEGEREGEITLFPAVPGEWARGGVSFRGLRASGGLSIDGAIAGSRISAALHNHTAAPLVRRLRVRLPVGCRAVEGAPAGSRVEDGFLVAPSVVVPAGGSVEFRLRRKGP